MKDAKKRVTQLENDLGAVNDKLVEIRTRLSSAEADKNAAEKLYDSLRIKRQTLLAQGEDAAGVTAELKKCKEKLELAEDAAMGLSAEQKRLSVTKQKLGDELSKAVIALDKAIFLDLVGTYNKQAQELAETVSTMWEVRRRLREDPLHSNIAFSGSGWLRNGLAIIPRLFILPDRPANVYDATFFDIDFPKP